MAWRIDHASPNDVLSSGGRMPTRARASSAVGKPGRLIEIDETERIFSNPSVQATEDYISGRFG